jgi:hypothetical protein
MAMSTTPMDLNASVAVALITALSGLISGLVVAYAKPLAEDRAAVLRERRADRRRHLEQMRDALLDVRDSGRVLPLLASALGDPQLQRQVELLLEADSEAESDAALREARRRLGRLIHG